MSIQNNDLEDLVSSIFSIDQYKSKIGKDENVVVVAFDIKDSDPAKDLSQFIETGHQSIDVDVSPGPTKEGSYKVFVELERNSKLFDSDDKILKDVSRADNLAKDFRFKAYKSGDVPKAWSKDNIDRLVISSRYDYLLANNSEAKNITERLKFLNKY
jgi:hypothetical protein